MSYAISAVSRWSLFYMTNISFTQYASRERILDILIRERVKWIGKDEECRQNKESSQNEEGRQNNPVYEELCGIMPKKWTWVTPGKKKRANLRNERTNLLKTAATALRFTIDRDRSGICKRKEGNKNISRPEYLPRLDSYINGIIESVRTGDIALAAPTVTGIFKDSKDDGNKIIVTFRPISVYTDLKTKILIKLASEYLTELLDPLFHEELLSYRQRRDYHGEHSQTKYMTTASDAITNIKKFRKEHDSAWVAECDIKKFYDIVNHNQVITALDRLIEEGNIERGKASGAVAVLKAYMDGYNFKESVLDKSLEPGFWDPYIKGILPKVKPGKKPVECRFGWLSEQEFFERGSYSPDTWETDYRKIGIPQGGVLSTLICNILMNDVDRAVVDESDGKRLFNRFGDDIILMHESEEGCRKLFDAYKKALKEHQLIYHDEKSVGDNYKDGNRTLAGYWDEKTKAPFRWGRGEGNAAEWIGFVGYEIDCEGNVRLRKSTFKKQINKICFKYHKATQHKEIKTDIQNCLKPLNRIPWSILKFEQLDFNPASREQMHNLDRYWHNKRTKAKRYLSTLPGAGKPNKAASCEKVASYAAVLAGKN